MEKVQDTLPLVYTLETFVDTITRSSFCASREDDMAHYELTQTFIKILSSKIKISTGMIEGINIPLKTLNSFKADINKYLLKPIRGFNDILKNIRQ